MLSLSQNLLGKGFSPFPEAFIGTLTRRAMGEISSGPEDLEQMAAFFSCCLSADYFLIKRVFFQAVDDEGFRFLYACIFQAKEDPEALLQDEPRGMGEKRQEPGKVD